MAQISRAALLLALFAFLAPAVAAEGEEASGEPSGEPSQAQGSGSPEEASGEASGSDPVNEVEECMCNGSENGTEPAPDPFHDRAACTPAEIDPIPNNDIYDIVEVDPDGCYRAAIKKAAEEQPVLVRNIICMIVERLP